jgi:hypothetical protein
MPSTRKARQALLAQANKPPVSDVNVKTVVFSIVSRTEQFPKHLVLGLVMTKFDGRDLEAGGRIMRPAAQGGLPLLPIEIRPSWTNGQS